MKSYSKYDKICVCLDNGHAKSTVGKKSPYSLNKVEPILPFEEWKFNRDIVNLIIPMLTQDGISCFNVTTENDIDVPLTIRAERANNYIKTLKKSGIFISVHANAYGNGKEWNSANGWCCYTTKGQNNSDKLAECLYDAADEILVPLGIRIRTDKTDGDRDYEENFTVIQKANMPAVLTENLFYTNINDCKFLNSIEGKEAIAQVHAEGIKRYIDKYIK